MHACGTAALSEPYRRHRPRRPARGRRGHGRRGCRSPSALRFASPSKATVTKNWNAVTEDDREPGVRPRSGLSGDAPSRCAAAGRRPCSSPSATGRVSFSPAVVRFVCRRRSPEREPDDDSRRSLLSSGRSELDCARRRRAVRGLSFRFFRSARDEISFRPRGSPSSRRVPARIRGRCARSGRASQEAQGELSEAALARSAHSGTRRRPRASEVDDRPRGRGDGQRRRARALGADVHPKALGPARRIAAFLGKRGAHG